MGALDYKTRRHRRNRLAAELAATYHPRRHFRLGRDVGWHWQFDNPNDLYRRRNRLTYTTQFDNAAWTKTNATVTANVDGVYDKLIPNAAATDGRVIQTVSGRIAGETLVWSIEGKYTDATFTDMRVYCDDGASNIASVAINVQTGAVTSAAAASGTWAAASSSVTDMGSGFFRVTLRFTTTGAAATRVMAWCRSTGNGTGGIIIGKADLRPSSDSAATPEYQDVPTTWAQAYLDAVGAERIYAWTDTAGTIPVTAIGDGIGLLLGREYGGARGANKVTTTDLTNAAWTSGGAFGNFAGSTVSGNTITGTGTNGSRSFRFAVSPGDTIEFTATAAFVAAGGATSAGLRLSFGTSGASLIVGTVADNTGRTSGTGAVRVQGTAPATASFCEISVVAFGAAGSQATFSDMAARTIPGTHLIQATGTARPTLSARVNLLLATEALNGASWTKGFGGTAVIPVITDGYTTDDEGKPASRVQLNKGAGSTLSDISNFSQISSGSVTGASYKARFKVKATSAGEIGKVILFRQAAGGGYLQVTLTSSWQEVTRNETAVSTSITYDFALRGTLGSSNSADFLLSQIDLRTAGDAARNLPAYQRVGATASDHDTDGFPHYALADGTDDFWASVGTVDGSATDKLTVVAAMTKLSDAAAGIVLETTTSFSGNAGTMVMSASGAVNSWGWGARGSTGAGLDPTGYAAPSTAVLLGVGDIAADYIALSVNGVSAASSNTDRGSGNFGNHTLYVLSRAGASLRFNGRFYGSTGRFGPMGDSERNNLTRWWMKRIGTA